MCERPTSLTRRALDSAVFYCSYALDDGPRPTPKIAIIERPLLPHLTRPACGPSRMISTDRN